MSESEKRPLMAIVEDEEEKKKIALKMAGEDKKYLILFKAYVNDTDEEYREWEYVTGRQKAYDTIAEYFTNTTCENGTKLSYDAFESRIIVQSEAKGVIPIDGIPVYKFVKSMLERGLVEPNSDFDIEEWALHVEENPDEETQEE